MVVLAAVLWSLDYDLAVGDIRFHLSIGDGFLEFEVYLLYIIGDAIFMLSTTISSFSYYLEWGYLLVMKNPIMHSCGSGN